MDITRISKTHPLILGAAASVMVVSLVGAAAISGLLPSAHSDKADAAAAVTAGAPATAAAHNSDGAPKLPAYANRCASCGTVASIHTIAVKGEPSGLGAVAGGVTGAVVGNQFGRGNGSTVMALLGAAGGALAGNEIEKNVKKHYSYRVTVHMDDGSYRTLSQSRPPAVSVGARVRIVDGAVVADS